MLLWLLCYVVVSFLVTHVLVVSRFGQTSAKCTKCKCNVYGNCSCGLWKKYSKYNSLYFFVFFTVFLFSLCISFHAAHAAVLLSGSSSSNMNVIMMQQ